MQPLDATPDDVRRRHLVVGPDGDLHGVSNLQIKAAQGRECQSKRALWRRFTCLGARGKQAQLAQAKGSKLNLLLMLVAQMSTYPRAIATRYCSWGSRNFKLTHGALTAFEDLGVVAVAVPRRARRCFSARLRRPPTRHRNCGCLPCQSATR